MSHSGNVVNHGESVKDGKTKMVSNESIQLILLLNMPIPELWDRMHA